MCARIQICVRPMRQARIFLRGQSKNSNRQMAPPTTPKVKPGKLLPPGHVETLALAAKYHTLGSTAAARVARIQGTCWEKFDRSISTTAHSGTGGNARERGQIYQSCGGLSTIWPRDSAIRPKKMRARGRNRLPAAVANGIV